MNKFYSIISAIFIPLLMPTYGLLIIFCFPEFSYIPTITKAVTVFDTFMLTTFCPFAIIYFFKRRGLVSDLYISNRKERPLPFLLILLFFLFWIFLLWGILQMPGYIIGLSVGTLISILLLAIISLKWKISAHTSGIGSLTGGICAICYHLSVNPVGLLITLFLLSALVAQARIEQKAHTPAQTIAGFAFGFSSVFFCIMLF